MAFIFIFLFVHLAFWDYLVIVRHERGSRYNLEGNFSSLWGPWLVQGEALAAQHFCPCSLGTYWLSANYCSWINSELLMREQRPYTVPFQCLAGGFNLFSIHSQNPRKLMAALAVCQEEGNSSSTSSGSSLSRAEGSTRVAMNLWMPDRVPGWPRPSGCVLGGTRWQQGETAAGGKKDTEQQQLCQPHHPSPAIMPCIRGLEDW